MKAQYASVSQIEIVSLTKLKAPASVWSVTMVLNHYAREGTSCFPSVGTIRAWLENTLPLRTIYFALKWLEDNGLISRQKATSRSRFFLKLRAKAQEASGQLQRIAKRVQAVAGEEKHKKKKIYDYHKRKKGKRLNRPAGAYGMSVYEADQRNPVELTTDKIIDEALEAKRQRRQWLGVSLSDAEAIKQRMKLDHEWSQWLYEHHLDIIKAMKTVCTEHYNE